MAILPVLFLARLAAVMCRLASTTRELGPARPTVGAVFVARVDLFLFVHLLSTFDDDEMNLSN